MTKSNEKDSRFTEIKEVKGTNSFRWESLNQNHPKRDPFSKNVFKCPMKCEGEKTFIAPGNCRICNAALVKGTELHQRYYL
jgi:Cu(I)/Ag(I) efflux system membrane fusion protein